ncbi:hypothetical protein B484DRAFT_336600, partial [Ochromonadaceae sp. CCMP2298]
QSLFDFSSLFIWATTFTRSLYPTVFNVKPPTNATGMPPGKHEGIAGLCWKASRVGERVSPYVGATCVLMAFHLLFLK